MAVRNNVIRFLDQRKIPYTAYELPSEKLSALETAQFLQVPIEIVFKTIVVTRPGGGKPILAMVPGDAEVDLKALAKVMSEKKLHLPTQREAERITKLQAGGISPLALLHRGFQVVLDEAARERAEIHVSGGQRGLNIRLPVKALIELTQAQIAPISR
jgi:Cys-tRNA(Pro)/Cys-tRNA(Cys) deacylase